MSDNQERSPDDTALAAQKFLETIGTAMMDCEIPPKLAINLFGFYARRVVAVEVEEGAEESHMMFQVFDAFAQGLGMKTGVKLFEGGEAEQMIADIEREGGGHSLQ
jgi:hypothetical protein